MRHLAPPTLFSAFLRNLWPTAPAQAYISADKTYDLALYHHYPTDGHPRNYCIAMLMYIRADADEHANAAYAIGLLLAAGNGFPKNQAGAYA